LIGAGYETNLAVPHNVYGWETLSGLEELAGGAATSWLGFGSAALRKQHEPLVCDSDFDWEKSLKNIRERTVIVYLALHGGCDGKGPYLLPNNADLSDDKRIRLQ